jgi:CRP/FNR family transcriptional regulator
MQNMLSTSKPDSVALHASMPVSAPLTEWASLAEVRKLLRYAGTCTAPIDRHLFRRRRLAAGQSVFLMGQEFDGLYVVRFGALKTVLTLRGGSERVIAFPLTGDVLGAEGACAKHYQCEIIALTACEVIRLPTDEYLSAGRSGNGMESMLCWAISREVARQQNAFGLTLAVSAEVRLRRFLVELSERQLAQGLCPRRLTLPMSRHDIGSYLGVMLGTVSRALSTLSQMQIIDICHRGITIRNREALAPSEDC